MYIYLHDMSNQQVEAPVNSRRQTKVVYFSKENIS